MRMKDIISFFDDKIKLLNAKSRKAKTKKTTIRYKSMAMAYSKVLNIFKETYGDGTIITIKKINDLPITDHMKNKITRLLKSPSSKKKKTQKLENELINFMGIGSTKAKELIEHGLTDVKQIRQKKYETMLTDQTRAFLSLKPVKKISHSDIAKLEPLLTKNIPNSKSELIMVGSYRRNTNFSKDIDIMAVSDDKKILKKIVKYYVKKIKNVVSYLIGDDKVSLIIKPFGYNKYYKVDIFRTPTKNKYAMLLYSTGSKAHNIRMRSIAKKKGFLLNQNGLFNRKTNKLLSSNAKSEKYFFTKLGMKYVDPEDRD